MRKIGALLYNWNQEPFIKAHLDMLTKHVDKTVVVLEQVPLGQYAKEHYGYVKDKSEEIVKNYPGVEWYEDTFVGEFGSDFLNSGLKYVQDCDIILRLDSDMLMTEENLSRLIKFIRETDYDCYRLDWAPYIINYYVTGRFDLGVFDSLEEYQPMAINPKHTLSDAVTYPDTNSYKIEWEDFYIHHLRGWRNCFPEGWEKTKPAKDLIKEYKGFVKLPDELIKLLCQEHQ